MRVIDSFGTDAEFNYKFYKEDIPGGRSVWGDLNLLLPQFMTMYRKLHFRILFYQSFTYFTLNFKQRNGTFRILLSTCLSNN